MDATYLTANITPSTSAAVLDAEETQLAIERDCAEAGRTLPTYRLLELIGRGSFGRVYKSTATHQYNKVVAVKIINIEDGDCVASSASDTFSDILKEVTTLRQLSDELTKNVNTVLDTLLVNHTVWIITEFCAGGSVATLMRATGPLEEKYIVPILRETAEAIHWIHYQGVIHRDIKAANILVHENGSIQLCDFGVAGVLQPTVSKRTTVTGTLHWMAPELFNKEVSYGKEVDIWAFGSTAYEIATGLPPNVRNDFDFPSFCTNMQTHSPPRLAGDQYSKELKHLVAMCLVHDPGARPSIEEVQKHLYLFDTDYTHPTAFLLELVDAYNSWSARGGNRQSLFSSAGAQPLARSCSREERGEGWNFDTIKESRDVILDNRQIQEMRDSRAMSQSTTPQFAFRAGRRKPPPMKAMQSPLETVFDQSAEIDYAEHAKEYYRMPLPSASAHPPLHNPTGANGLNYEDFDFDDLEVGPIITVKPPKRQASSQKPQTPSSRDWVLPRLDWTAAEICRNTSVASEPPTANEIVASPHRNAKSHEQHVKIPAPRLALPSRTLPRPISDISLVDLDESIVEPWDMPTMLPARPASVVEDLSGTLGSLELGNDQDTIAADAPGTDNDTTSCSSDESAFHLEKILYKLAAINAHTALHVAKDAVRDASKSVKSAPLIASCGREAPGDDEHAGKSSLSQGVDVSRIVARHNLPDDPHARAPCMKSGQRSVDSVARRKTRQPQPASTCGSCLEDHADGDSLQDAPHAAPMTAQESQFLSLYDPSFLGDVAGHEGDDVHRPRALSRSREAEERLYADMMPWLLQASPAVDAVWLPPPLSPPSASVLAGQGTVEDLADEFRRMLFSMDEHLSLTAQYMGGSPARTGV